MAFISRDPFARSELHRESVKPYFGQTCAWCGNLNARGTLYQYRIESDGGRTSYIPRFFCSVSCMRSFHG